MDRPMLTKAINVLLFFVLTIGILYFGRSFFVPVTFAALLAMLFMPVSNWLEKKGFSRGLATVCCILILLILVTGTFILLGMQLSSLAKDMSGVKEQATNALSQLRQYISDTLGVSMEKQEEMMQKQQESGSGAAGKTVAMVLGGLMGIFTNLILVMVDMFLFMYFRNHFKNFILKIVPAADKAKTKEIIQEASKVAQQYLGGTAIMIVLLWVMYGIGFSIVGVKHPIFFAVLCGLLEIVPFIGNITGTALTLLMSVAQGGGTTMIIGILVTYGLVQFIQSNFLQPLIVGAEVNINPVFTIISLIAAEMIWGLAGMILVIPLLGIVKIICDHVEPLKPYGFLLGPPAGKKKESGFKTKIMGWFGRKSK